MSRMVFSGEPQLWGSRLVWGGTLDPGADYLSAGSTSDSVDVWKVWADDAAGTQKHSELVLQGERALENDVMPGDSYETSMDLGIEHDGYYHVLVTVDNNDNGPTYELHVRVEDGQYELKSLYLKFA